MLPSLATRHSGLQPCQPLCSCCFFLFFFFLVFVFCLLCFSSFSFSSSFLFFLFLFCPTMQLGLAMLSISGCCCCCCCCMQEHTVAAPRLRDSPNQQQDLCSANKGQQEVLLKQTEELLTKDFVCFFQLTCILYSCSNCYASCFMSRGKTRCRQKRGNQGDRCNCIDVTKEASCFQGACLF